MVLPHGPLEVGELATRVDVPSLDRLASLLQVPLPSRISRWASERRTRRAELCRSNSARAWPRRPSRAARASSWNARWAASAPTSRPATSSTRSARPLTAVATSELNVARRCPRVGSWSNPGSYMGEKIRGMTEPRPLVMPGSGVGAAAGLASPPGRTRPGAGGVLAARRGPLLPLVPPPWGGGRTL